MIRFAIHKSVVLCKCAYVCEHVFVHLSTERPTQACTTGGQRLKLGVFLSHFQPYFLRQGPSLNLGLIEGLR